MKAKRRVSNFRLTAPRKIPRAGPMGIAVDTETTGIRIWQGDAPFAFSFCNEYGELGYIEWEVDPYTREVIPDWGELEMISEFAKDQTIDKVWWNGPFDRTITQNVFQMEWKGIQHEGIFAAHTCNSLEFNYRLKYLADRYVGQNTRDQDELRRWTIKARNVGKNRGWKLATKDAGGTSPVPADYWMLKYSHPHKAHLIETYALIDAQRTMELWLLYISLMDDESDLWETYNRELILMPVVERMSRRGIRVSPLECRKEWQACDIEWREALEFLQTSTGIPDFDPTDNQIRWLLYTYLGKPITKRTKGGKKGKKLPSVAAGTLVEYSQIPEIAAVFRYKIARKGQSAFFENYLKYKVVDHIVDGYCIHTNFVQSEKKTARFSARTPNLQQVPDAISTRATRPIQGRGPFGPRKGYHWYLFDYEQLEARIFAVVAEEPTMLKAFNDGRDLHTECANKAWGGYDLDKWPEGNGRNTPGVNPAGIRAAINALGMDGITVGGHDVGGDVERMRKVTDRLGWMQRDSFISGSIGVSLVDVKYQDHMDDIAARWLKEHGYDIVAAEKSIGKKNTRAKAKMVLFARTFGGGPNAIKDLMYVSYDVAKQFLQDYAEAMPGITKYIDKRTAEGKRLGYIYNLFGRKLMVPKPYFDKELDRWMDPSYRCVNYTVQGSAADLLKIAMIKVDGYLQRRIELDAHIVLTIHDELVIEAPPHFPMYAIKGIKSMMEDSEGKIKIETPVKVERAMRKWTQTELVLSPED